VVQCGSVLVATNVVTISQILSTFKMEGARSSETSVVTVSTGRGMPEDGILWCCSYLQCVKLVRFFSVFFIIFNTKNR
jgi:hypothetical protein